MNRCLAVILVVSCVAVFVLAGANAQNASVRSDRVASGGWRHLALEHAGDSVTADPQLSGKIEQLGKDGWELVSVTSLAKDGTTARIVFCFKRPR